MLESNLSADAGADGWAGIFSLPFFLAHLEAIYAINSNDEFSCLVYSISPVSGSIYITSNL